VGTIGFVLGITGLALAGLAAVKAAREALLRRREAFIGDHALAQDVLSKLVAHHPALDLQGLQLVHHALRTYFRCHLRHPRAHLAMPSKVVDDLWHAFILDTPAYAAFCRRAFGGFFHHVPASGATPRQRRAAGLLRVWAFSCQDESVDPRHPARLPLLFAIDARLAIAGGFVYDMQRLARGHQSAATTSCGGGGGACGSGCGGGCGGGA
jgi:hypothetical protein